MALCPSAVRNDLRLMLLGHSCVGKSATANVILGKETFKETETIQCEIQSARVGGRNTSVIDTPGINNPSLSTEQWRAELKKGLLLSSPGPHVFLLVTKVGKLSDEERNTVTWIRENFGEEALKFTMILFIGREEITNRQWVNFSEGARTKDLISSCSGRYCVINSKREANPAQIIKLLDEIEAMVQHNGGQFYTQETYGAVSRTRTAEVRQEKEKVRKGPESKPKPQYRGLELKKDDAVTGINVQYVNVTPPKEDKASVKSPNQDSRLEVQKDKAVTGINVQYVNVIPPKTQELSLSVRKGEVEAKFVQEHFRRQVETRREREGTKWEKEIGPTGGVKSDPVCDVRIVLLGGAGVGKSSSGNTILGREAFGNDITRVLTMGRRQDGMVGNKSITVVDTKGYTEGANSQLCFLKYCEDLERCLSLCRPGPHVFVLVVPSPHTFSFPVQLLYKQFGPEVLKRTLVLITRGDSWGRNHKVVLNNSSALRQLVRNCGEDYHIFNNQQKEDRTQVKQLLQKLESLIRRNGQGYCTTEMYQRKGQEPGICSLI